MARTLHGEPSEQIVNEAIAAAFVEAKSRAKSPGMFERMSPRGRAYYSLEKLSWVIELSWTDPYDGRRMYQREERTDLDMQFIAIPDVLRNLIVDRDLYGELLHMRLTQRYSGHIRKVEVSRDIEKMVDVITVTFTNGQHASCRAEDFDGVEFLAKCDMIHDI